MQKEYKGLQFLAVSPNNVIALTRLRCSVFIYLSLNKRMLKIRDRDQNLDRFTIDHLVRNGHAHFFILEPKSNPGSYDMSPQTNGPLNPVVEGIVLDLPEGGKKPDFTQEELEAQVRQEECLENAEKRLRPGWDTGEAGAQVGNSEPEIDDAEKVVSSAEQADAGQILGKDLREAEAEQTFSPDKKQAESEQAFGADKRLKEDEQGVQSEVGEKGTQSSFGTGQASILGDDKFGSESISDLEKKNFSAEGQDKSGVRTFTAEEKKEKSAESVVTFKAEEKNAERPAGQVAAEQTGSGSSKEKKHEQDPGKVTTFKADENNAEEATNRVVTFKAEEKKESKAAKVITFKNEKKADAARAWVNHLEEKPVAKIAAAVETIEEELAACSPEQKKFVEELREVEAGTASAAAEDPAAKVSHALHEHLDKLRGELAHSATIKAVGIEQKQDFAVRRQDLKEQIARVEATAELVESLDEHFLGVADLPEGVSTRSALATVQQLEQSLERMKGAVLLSESEHAIVQNKVDSIKAKHPELAATQAVRLSDTLLEKAAALKENSVPPVDLSLLKEAFQIEVTKATVSSNVAANLTDRRNDLIELLDQIAGDDETEQEKLLEAAKIQGDIRRLEKLVISVDSEKGADPKEIAPFLGGAAIELKDSSPAGLQKMAESLEQLRSNCVSQKVAALEAEAELKSRILGKPVLPDHLAHVASMTAINRIQDQISEKRQELAAQGKANDPVAVEAMQSAIVKEMQTVQTVVQLEGKLAEAQIALTQLLDKEKAGILDAKEVETQALLFQRDIRDIESLREAVQTDQAVDSARLAVFVTSPRPGPDVKPGAAGWNQLLAATQKVKNETSRVTLQAAKVESALEKAMANTLCVELKKSAVSSKNLEHAKKAVSRHLKAFFEKGRDPSEKDVWEISQLVKKEAEKAHTEMGIARAITKLSKEHKQLTSGGGAVIALEEAKMRSGEIHREIKKLEVLARSVSRGDPVSKTALKPFIELIPDVFVFTRDKPFEEESVRILGELEAVQERLIKEKVEAIEAAAPVKAEEKARVEAEREHVRIFKGEQAAKVPGQHEKIVFEGAKTYGRTDDVQEVTELGDGNGGLKESMFLSKGDLPFSEELELKFKAEKEKRDDYLRVFTSEKKKEDESMKLFKGENEALPQSVETKIFKADSPEAKSEMLFETGETPEEIERRVLGTKEARDLQASVYATTLLRAFGYRNRQLEEDLVAACILLGIPTEKLAKEFSERIITIHAACRGEGDEDEMVLRDMAQAARMAREYIAYPGVVTGAFSFNADIFGSYCLSSRKQPGLDPQLLERARQSVAFGFAGADREHAVLLANYVSQKIAHWRKANEEPAA